MDAAQYRAQAAEQMRENALQAQILRLAKALHWLAYHTHDSRRSQPGFPDLVLVSAQQGRVLFRELKRQKGYETPDQRRWRDQLAVAGADVAVWRPADLIEGRIEADLRGHPGRPVPDPIAELLAADASDPAGGDSR